MTEQSYLENLTHRLWQKQAEFHHWSPLGELLREAAKALELVTRKEALLRLERGY